MSVVEDMPDSVSNRSRAEPGSAGTIKSALGKRAIVLVGLMGAGKSTVGRRLANRLDLPFCDADAEIEAAAACSIPEIFDRFGEEYFRNGERRVINRLLDGKPRVVATGGGAYLNPETRAVISERGVSVWLRADLEVLVKRVLRRDHRPLIKNYDLKGSMEHLMAERYPVYAQADITVDTGDGPHDSVVRGVMRALTAYFDGGSHD